MPHILSSDDLPNNYNEISSYCHKHDEPVFITRNEKRDLVVMSMETYEELSGHFELNTHILKEMQDIDNYRVRPLSQVMDNLQKRRNRWSWEECTIKFKNKIRNVLVA